LKAEREEEERLLAERLAEEEARFQAQCEAEEREEARKEAERKRKEEQEEARYLADRATREKRTKAKKDLEFEVPSPIRKSEPAEHEQMLVHFPSEDDMMVEEAAVGGIIHDELGESSSSPMKVVDDPLVKEEEVASLNTDYENEDFHDDGDYEDEDFEVEED
jgi:hypothetical protein